jgi:lipid II isoglutaminyl synthase (glutamine-hydrolysing)
VSPLPARSRVAVAAVRAVNAASRLARTGAGTVAGGRAGLAIDPGLLARLAAGRDAVVVTGTNGKTTTTAFVAAGWGGAVATNATGANMPPGMVAALAGERAARAALESDEAWLAEVVARVRPRVVVLLNLSRDQLDRATEVRRLAERWRECLADAGAVVVANANDPLVVFAAEGAPDVRYCDVPTYWLGDAASCPKCTRPIAYSADGWSCECGFARPRDVHAALGTRLRVGAAEVDLALGVPGTFNRANAALAVVALAEVGVAPAESAARIGAVTEVAGRFARRRWRGRELRLVLAKNPAGVAAVLADGPPAGDVWVAINDEVVDGRDPSWLYDAPFDRLAGRTVSCLGSRRLDLAARLDYGGVDAFVVDDEATLAGGGPATLIANYTAFTQWSARGEPC